MLKNQVIAVFGGGRGIGKAIAWACAQAGASVAISARTLAEVENVKDEILASVSEKPRVIAGQSDVASYESVNSFIQRTERELGPIDGIVCAAGIYGAIGPVDETPPEQWKSAIEVNLIGTFHCIHAVARQMKQRKKGKIVLFSGGGQGGIPNFSAYTASKGGVWRLTETLGTELAPFGVQVNAIAPGLVNTRFLEDLLQAGEEKVGTELYQKSLKQKKDGGIAPEQAADLAVFLLSSDSGHLTGKIISARWDNYRAFNNWDELNSSDIFTVKRVVDAQGNTRVS